MGVYIDGSVGKRAAAQMNEKKCLLKAVYIEEKFNFEQH